MPFIDAESNVIEDFLCQYPAAKPVVMLNLLRFSELANYQPGETAAPCTGLDAFKRYGAGVAPLIGAAGGEQVWQGRQAAMLIGPQDKDWHLIVLVRYPSAQAFLAMVQSDAYKAVSFHRSAALADSRLIAMEAL